MQHQGDAFTLEIDFRKPLSLFAGKTSVVERLDLT